MSKRIICVLLVFVLVLMAGCNKTVLYINWMFTKATVNYGDRVVTYDVEKWTRFDDSDMIQFTDTDGIVHLTHSANVILEG